jgi:hypothetical protein
LLFLFFQLKKYGSNVVFSQSWIQFLYNSIVTYFSGCAKHPLHQTIWQCHSRLKKHKKKKHSSSGNPSDTTAYHRTWRQCAAMKGRQMDVLLDGRNPPKNADLGMVYSWVYHIILYVYIYMYIYIYIAWFIQIYDDWVYRIMHIYIYNYPQMVYVNGVSNPCWGR